jgi:hypothetical protein
LNKYELVFGLLFILIVFSVEYYQENHKERIKSFYTGHGLKRWTISLALSLSIIFFGFHSGRKGDKMSENTKSKQEQFIYEEF